MIVLYENHTKMIYSSKKYNLKNNSKNKQLKNTIAAAVTEIVLQRMREQEAKI